MLGPMPPPPPPAKPTPKPAAKPTGRANPPRGCLARIVLWSVVLLLTGSAALAVGYLWLDATLPEVFTFEEYRKIAKESSRVYAAGGEVVARFGDEIRTVLPPERIPKLVRLAMICAEDAAFYDHPGLDLLGIARALWVDVTRGHYAHGASTITQQLAKTRFLGREKTIVRKLKELVLARKLETRLQKDEILTLYLNEVYFGHGRYGIEDAARFFFGRSAAELDVAQAALLTGMVNSPGRMSPLRHPDRAKARRTYVLGQMHKHGYINDSDLQKAEAQPLPVALRDTDVQGAPWYIDAVRRVVLAKVTREQLANTGLRIEVALDLGLQAAAEQAVGAGLARLDKQYKVFEPSKRYANDGEIAGALAKLAVDQASKAQPGQVLQAIVLGRDDVRKAWRLGLGAHEGFLADADLLRYRTWQPAKGVGPKKADTAVPLVVNRGDQLRVSVREVTEDGVVLSPELGPQAALVAIEPQTRLVRALVGGDDFDLHPFDRTRALRQPGSTFKTFTYGAAIEAGLVTADTELKDEKRTYKVGKKGWTPRNFSGFYDGKTYQLRDALAHSINSIAVEIAARVGPDKVASFAERAGIRSPLVAGLPLALGASSVTPFELTNAYATIAAGGRFAEPILVTRIVDRAGKDVYLAPRGNGQQVHSTEVSKQLADMLGEVVRKGSAKAAGAVGRPLAGKTGTSNGGRDTWFVGFSAELCAGIWVGYDDRTPMAKATGGANVVPIFVEFIQNGLAAVPVAPLPRLPHVLAGPIGNLPAPVGDAEMGAGDLHDDELLPETPAQPAPVEPLAPRKRPALVDDEAVE